MKTEEAIGLVNSLRKNKDLKYVISTETYLKHDKDIKNKVLDDVIELLKRGETFEEMWKELKIGVIWCSTIVENSVKDTINKLEQKYLNIGGKSNG